VNNVPLTLVAKMVFGDVLQWQKVAATRIGKQDIDDARLLPDDIVKPVEIGQVGDVASHASDVAANFADRGVKFRLPAACDEDARAFLGEPLRRGKPDAAICAGHHGDLAIQSAHNELLCMVSGKATRAYGCHNETPIRQVWDFPFV
jgi:hypothetical protein